MACFNLEVMEVKLVVCMRDEKEDKSTKLKEKLLLVNNKDLQFTL
jgi:hypothetical protein